MDRSARAIGLASKRNHAAVSSGQARFQIGSFETTPFAAATFDRIVAVHVNAFWTRPGAGAANLRKALARRGALYLVYQAPPGLRPDRVVPRVREGLEAGGFARIEVHAKALRSGRAIAVIAQ